MIVGCFEIFRLVVSCCGSFDGGSGNFRLLRDFPKW